MKGSLFLFCLLYFVINSFSQKVNRIEIVNSDLIEFDESNDVKAKRLLGNVHFRHEDIEMYCDSAYYFDENRIEAFGAVHLNRKDSFDLYGRNLIYTGRERNAIIKGNVILKDRGMVLTTENLVYEFNENLAKYFFGGKILKGKETLVSNNGDYYTKRNLFFFKGKVKLLTSDYTIYSDTLEYNTISEVSRFYGPTRIVSKDNLIYCENGWYNSILNTAQFNRNAFIFTNNQFIRGDSLYYDRKIGYAKAICFVSITDTANNIIVFGDFAEVFEKKDYSYISKSALLINYNNGDTLFMHADTLLMTYDSTYFNQKRKFLDENNVKDENLNHLKKGKKGSVKSEGIREFSSKELNFLDSLKKSHRILKAYNSSKFYRKDLQGVCDSLVYYFQDSLINMYGIPILWSEKSQMSADKVHLYFSKSSIDKMFLESNAFIISRFDSLRFNQIKGKNIFGFFKDNSLFRVDVKGNGVTNYWVADEKANLIGATHAESSSIRIGLKENQVKKISLLDKPDSKIIPIKKVDMKDILLPGFIWNNHLRPKKFMDIFK